MFMKVRLLFYSIVFIGLSVITSCSSMYIPSTVNIPLLESKGEKQVELTSSTNSLHLTGNYAFSQHYSVMFNGGLSYRNFSDNYDIYTTINSSPGKYMRETGEFAHKYFEAGIGRFNILQNEFKLEVFGGVGYGTAIDDIWNLKYDANYYLGFTQINFGSTTNWIDLGGSVRLATTFYDYSYELKYGNALPQNTKFSMFHIEPMGFIRMGGKNLKFVARCGLSKVIPFQSLGTLNVDRGIYNGKVHSTVIHLSVGVNYKFGYNKK